jgi:hypothetical protein
LAARGKFLKHSFKTICCVDSIFTIRSIKTARTNTFYKFIRLVKIQIFNEFLFCFSKELFLWHWTTYNKIISHLLTRFSCYYSIMVFFIVYSAFLEKKIITIIENWKSNLKKVKKCNANIIFLQKIDKKD